MNVTDNEKKHWTLDYRVIQLLARENAQIIVVKFVRFFVNISNKKSNVNLCRK